MKRRGLLLALAVSAMACISLALVLHIVRTVRSEEISHAGETVTRQGWILQCEDDNRTVREHLRVLLIVGTDSYDEDLGTGTDPDIWYNYSQADFVLYTVFDLKNRTITPIQLNRDTMCDVPWLTVSGKVGGSNREQLALSHTYGSGGDDSARNVARTVSGLLFGAPIDNYVALNMSAVPVINDMFGGVRVTLSEDLTDLDPRYIKGNIVTLSGEEALAFVRQREHDPVDANLPRMNRQRQYLEALQESALASLEDDTDLVTESYDDILPYLVTDLNLNSYSDYVNWFSEFNVQDFVVPAGSYSMGEQWAEFNVDSDDLWRIVTDTLT